MKLKDEIVKKVNNVPTRQKLGVKLKLSDQTIQKTLTKNANNNRLTRADALLAIGAEVGIKNITELLQK